MRAIGSISLGLVFAIVLGIVQRATAEGGCCAHCGCQARCHKVCRLVCEEKKVTVTCWGCKCEDFCIPGHSKPCCQHCEEVCTEDAADCDAPCTHAKTFVWTEWIPGCAKLHTKKKLMKKTVTKKVPSYKWVVEDLCCDCQARCDAAAVQSPTVPGLVPTSPIAAAVSDEGPVAPGLISTTGEEPWFRSLLPTRKN